jgi:soluble cytochrome b562
MKHKLIAVSMIGAGLAIPTAVVAQNDDWKQKMEDAQEAKDDLMDSVDAKSAPKAAEATAKMLKILLETKQFWAGQKMADVVKLADDNIAALNEMAKLAGSGNMEQGKAAFTKVNSTCSACHDTHPENRLKK